MNKNNIEVELKFRVIDEDRFNNWLNKNATLKFSNHQVDDYFTPVHRNFFDKKLPTEFLRIRKSDNKSSITYKNWHPSKTDISGSHCDEYETEVENGEQIRKIFDVLDIKYLLTVDKTRSSYEYKNFEIEFDDVKDVGTVCEIELKDGYESIENAREQIMNLANTLGFTEEDRGEDLKMGYAYIIAKKKGLVIL